MGDVKHYLRKMDFPDVVPEALGHIQKLWLPNCTSHQLSLMKELSQEFVFFEVDPLGRPREPKLTPIKELQVLERFSTYFRDVGPEKKLATFIFLFPLGTSMLDQRLPILKKLVSLSIATGNSNLLTYVGAWMQLNGCASENSIFITKCTEQERFRTIEGDQNILSVLPHQSPLFCASIFTSLSNVYKTTLPPDNIVKILVLWMQKNPTFCMEPLNINIPSTFNFKGPETPICEIIQWSLLASLKPEHRSNSIYVSLNSAILESLMHAKKFPNITKWNAMPIQKLIAIVQNLENCDNVESQTFAINRLACYLRIGLENYCISLNKDALNDFIEACNDFPFNNLLKLIIESWSQILVE